MECKNCGELHEVLREVIDVLCEYDVIHTVFPENYIRYALTKGEVIDDLKKIFIASDSGYHHKRMAVIHELIHTFHFKKGDLDFLDANNKKKLESLVSTESEKLFYKIYPQKEMVNVARKKCTAGQKMGTKLSKHGFSKKSAYALGNWMASGKRKKRKKR